MVNCSSSNLDKRRKATHSHRRKSLKFWYTNAQSLNNKLDEFHATITEENPDVIGITETWASTNNFDSEYNVNNNYTVFRKDRKTSTTGGGVMLLIKKDLSVTETKYPEENIGNESLWCNIKTGNDKFLKVGVCYTPRRNDSIDTRIAKEIEWASKSDVVLMGDFNYAGIDWNTFKASSNDDIAFLETLRDNYLYQHVKEPTRGDNLLDLVLSLSENDIDRLEINHSLGKSDHKTLIWDYLVSSERKENTIKVPDFRKARFDELRTLINNENWDVLKTLNAEKAWEKFKNVVHDGMVACIPFKRFRKANKPMWMNNEISQGSKLKKKKWKKLKRCNNHNCSAHKLGKGAGGVNKHSDNCLAYKEFKEIEKDLHKKIRVQKAGFEEDIALDIKNNPKKFYSYVRSKNKSKEGIGPLLSDNDQLVESDTEMVQILNQFFSSVFTTEDMVNIPKDAMSVEMEINNISCTLEDITKGLLKLNVNKSCGPDKLYPRVLKELANEIAKPLQIIFNKTILEGKVPEDWKLANVTPIFKKGSRSSRSNYRPVSLTSVVCRLLESLIRDHISEYLNNNHLILDSQHGFCKGKSCQTNLLTFFDKVTQEIDKNREVDVIYPDFANFILGIKLKSLGITGNIFKWIEDWLSNRSQRVVVNGVESTWTPVTSGVPQGSVLGPLLFLIYINDIDQDVNSLISKFADDTKIARTILDNNDNVELQKDLELLGQWADKWQMKFNADKCKVIRFGGGTPSNYVMDGKTLENIEEEKDLGVLIHKTLKLENQCQAATSRANRILGMLKRNITSRKKEVILPLYRTLVRPHLEYSVQFWNPYLVKDIKLLENVQRRATRLISGMKGLPYEERLKQCNLFSLSRRRLRGDMIQVFKILKNIDKIKLEDLGWELNVRNSRGHNLRLIKRRSRLDLRKHFFTQRIVNYWNKLPQKIVSLSSVQGFKLALDKYMTSDGVL